MQLTTFTHTKMNPLGSSFTHRVIFGELDNLGTRNRTLKKS